VISSARASLMGRFTSAIAFGAAARCAVGEMLRPIISNSALREEVMSLRTRRRCAPGATCVACMAAAFGRWEPPSVFVGSSGRRVAPASWSTGGSAWQHEGLGPREAWLPFGTRTRRVRWRPRVPPAMRRSRARTGSPRAARGRSRRRSFRRAVARSRACSSSRRARPGGLDGIARRLDGLRCRRRRLRSGLGDIIVRKNAIGAAQCRRGGGVRRRLQGWFRRWR
jgi:hypothetical protein